MQVHDATTPAARYPGYKFNMEWIEINSNLISKYLPNYKIYTDSRFTFALDKDCRIICLGETWPLGRPFKSAPDFRVIKFSVFFKDLGLEIKEAKTAIDIVKLADVLFGKGNVNDSILEHRTKYWSYMASRKGYNWIIKMSYIGPRGGCTTMQPYWEVLVDKSDTFKSFIKISQGIKGLVDDIKREM